MIEKAKKLKAKTARERIAMPTDTDTEVESKVEPGQYIFWIHSFLQGVKGF